ncbi:MAG TPA: SGNH/GDSL hydrolase family protein [Enhygromyxa sp.]|nr:SGNH/GDSL hydrolase family protein [Enhygromyxa sp.]
MSNPAPRKRLTKLLAGFALGLLAASFGPAELAGANPEDDPPPKWRFKQKDRPIKVVVLAGSIGAWQKDPYAEHFENWCSNIEVENISKVGYGAYHLRKRFMQQVIENPYVNLRDPNYEYWLVFQGGLNSVGTPEKTNKEIRQLFLSAHQRGISIVGLSLTPWGEDSDSKRWKGIAGLTYKRHTQTVVDYVVGRSTPQQALGTYRDRRDDPDAPWDPAELADVGIDLYDSDLRDRNAPLRDLDKLRAELRKSKSWQKAHADLDEAAREQALEHDAQAAAEIPRWYLRPDLRSFDDIHPNEHGHRLLAEIACPQLPASWGCSCPAIGSGASQTADAAE